LSGGVGGAAGKLTSKVIQAATRPANAFGSGASKVLTGAAAGAVGGATGGATNSATTQYIETGTVDASGVGEMAIVGAVTGGVGGGIAGKVRANATQKVFNDPKASNAFTSASEPGERAAAAASAAASTASSTAVKAVNRCNDGGC
jgi:hypothetical protein